MLNPHRGYSPNPPQYSRSSGNSSATAPEFKCGRGRIGAPTNAYPSSSSDESSRSGPRRASMPCKVPSNRSNRPFRCSSMPAYYSKSRPIEPISETKSNHKAAQHCSASGKGSATAPEFRPGRGLIRAPTGASGAAGPEEPPLGVPSGAVPVSSPCSLRIVSMSPSK